MYANSAAAALKRRQFGGGQSVRCPDHFTGEFR